MSNGISGINRSGKPPSRRIWQIDIGDKFIRQGQIFTGKIMQVGDDVAFVDLGFGIKHEGIIRSKEIKGLKAGQKLKVRVLCISPGEHSYLIYLVKYIDFSEDVKE